MRNLGLIIAVSLVLAMSGMAGAGTIPLGPSGQIITPIVMHLTNYDDTTVYNWNGGFLADGTTAIVLGQKYDPSLVATTFAGIKLEDNETTWGIFKIDQILHGEITGPNGITPVATPPTNVLYTDGDAGKELVGIFYGQHDTSVQFLTPGALGLQQIISAGQNQEMFIQPSGTYNNGGPVGGPGASLRVDANEYPTVGYDGTGTDTLMAGATRVLTGTSQPGLVTEEFVSLFTPDGGGSGTGTFELYISLGTLAEAFNSDTTSAGFAGVDNPLWDLDTFPNGTAVAAVPGTTADFRLKGNTEPTLKEWVVRSSDPLTGAFAVPEPLTMLGVFMGIGGLGGYIRKRRNS